MLVQQKLENLNIFTPQEKIVALYILKNKENIKQLSVGNISKATYTSPSTTVRMAQKIGYSGWKEFKELFCEEVEYLKTHFNEINPNIPFNRNDSMQDIAGKIATLLVDSIYDTVSLLDHTSLEKAIEMISKAKNIFIFAIGNTASVSYDFKSKMRLISKKVEVVDNPDDFIFAFNECNKDSCCIFISYSGETFQQYNIESYLMKRKFLSITITSIGDNSIKTYSDCHLLLSTREKLSTKIGNYVSNESIHYILDVLYSGVFAMDYNYNWNLKMSIAKEIDKDRYSSVSILQENN